MASSSPRSVRVWLLVGLLGIGLLAAFLFVADPFGLGHAIDRPTANGAATSLGEEGAAPEKAPVVATAGALSGRFGEADLGRVRLRLLDVVGRRPIASERLLLYDRTGGRVEAVSGEDGVTLFERLVPRRGYRLEIQVPEHAAVHVQGVEVKPGATTDLGDILVGANLVLRGRVVDGSGRAVAGASVAVYTEARSMLAEGIVFAMAAQLTTFPSALDEATSDDQGWFTLKELGAGTYRLEARRAGYATRYEPGVVVAEDRPARDMTIVLGEGAAMIGVVKDESGKPVEGARVVAVKDDGRRFLASSTFERDVATTDAAGRYAIETLMQGMSYRFGVLADGFATLYETNPVELLTKKMEKDFQLLRGGSVTGRVVRKEDGKPVSGAEVAMAVGRLGFGRGRGGDASDRAAPLVTRTGDDGAFRFDNVLPGPVLTAQVRAPGYVSYVASPFAGSPWGEIAAGEEFEAPLVELERGGSITGQVTDASTGAPIADAQVTALPQRMGFMAMATGTNEARTDATGAFALDGLAPASYRVLAIADGFAPSNAADPTHEVAVPEVGGSVVANVALSKAAVVEGVVTDSKGEPVAGARVRARVAPPPRGEGRGRGFGNRLAAFLPGGSAADLTDQQGHYVLEGLSGDQRWLLTAEADEFVPTESDPIEVRVGEAKKVDLVLLGGGAISGRVVDDRGGFVEGARVRVGHLPDDRAGQGSLSAWEVDRYLEPSVYVTTEDGKFLVPNIPPGIAVVKVEHDGFVTFYKRDAVVRADETLENYTVSLSRGDVMEGLVKSSDGRPISGAVVAVTKAANPGQDTPAGETPPNSEVEPRLNDRTDANGHFHVENVPPGTWNVIVYFAPGYVGYAGGQDESAIRRDVPSSSKTVEFRLKTAETGGFPGPGGPRPPRAAPAGNGSGTTPAGTGRGGGGRGGRVPPGR